MADEALKPLIECGPFTTIDTTTSPIFTEKGSAGHATNVNTWRIPYAFTNELGRVNNNVFSAFPNTTITAMAANQNGPAQEVYMNFFTSPSTNQTIFFIPNSLATTPVTSATVWSQAVQYGTSVFTNGGQQFNNYEPTQALSWQYPIPTITPVLSQIAGAGLSPGTYSYAFTHVVIDPSGNVRQETSPEGIYPVNGAYPFSITLTTPGDIVLTLPGGQQWGGTNPDGSTYNTLIYRLSTNQPVWFAVVNRSGAAPYTDGASDTFISSHEQLDFHHDAPPASSANSQGAVFAHKERVWWFGLALPVTVPGIAPPYNPPQVQCQLWASDYGVPWSFNSDPSSNQVMLVGDDATAQGANYSTLSDSPQNGISLSSVAILFKARTTWVLYGDDPATFIVRKVANLGCAAPGSVAQYNNTAYWLTEDGVYTFDGWNQPQYISEKVRNTLENVISVQDRQNSVGFVARRTYYLSFPATGITLAYYIPTGVWELLGYALTAVISTPANLNEDQNGTAFGEVLAARDGTTPTLDWWFAGGENDLGGTITADWTSPLTDSQAMGVEKLYRFVEVLAPFQDGQVTCIVTVDPGSQPPKVFTTTFQLSQGGASQPQTRHIAAIRLNDGAGGSELRGFMAQIQLMATTALGQTAPLTIYKAGVWGEFNRYHVIPD